MFKTLLIREWHLTWKNKGQWMMSLSFIFVVVAMFPLALGADLHLLKAIGIGVIWVAFLLAILLSSAGQFSDDWHDGSLDLILLSPHPLISYVWAKLCIAWLTLILPLLIAVPLILIQFQLPFSVLPQLWLSLFLGGISIITLALFGAALTVNIARSGILTVLVILPLCIPILIFATQLFARLIQGLAVNIDLLLLLSAALAIIALLPWVIAWLLRIQTRIK